MAWKAKFVIAFYSFGLLHHLYAYYYSQTQLDYSKSTDVKIHNVKKFQNRFLTSWNMGLQTLYFLVALIFEFMLVNKEKVATNVLEKYSKIRGYMFSALVFPSTSVVAFFFWLFYHINKEYVLPNGLEDICPDWLNHSIHTNIIFLPIIELSLQKIWIPSAKMAIIGLFIYSHIYHSLYLFTYFESGVWLYPLYEVISWSQRILLMELMFVMGVSTCLLGLFIQKIKPKSKCDITKATYKARVAKVTKKLL